MFPITLLDNLDESYAKKWHTQFVVPGRQRAEGIWRRTQEEATKDKSGWKSPEDARRRMVHFLDEYDVIKTDATYNFVLKGVYLWVSVSLPHKELWLYDQDVTKALAKGGWKQTNENTFKLHDLEFTINTFTTHPEDTKAGRALPQDYQTIEYTLKSNGFDETKRLVDSPWRILSTGIRKLGTRSTTVKAVSSLEKLVQYLPMQIETGGGASIELGIPPLNHLHRIYNVTKINNGDFVFGDEDYLLPEVLGDPTAFYKKAAHAYVACLNAQPNDFYTFIKELSNKQLVVGDVLTNNFDGLTSVAGLTEKYIRRYDEPKQYPKITFDSRAKSLLVVGSHADRRTVQKQAREQGLKVIFIDPEMYVDYYGNTIQYPLEQIEDDDLLVHLNAVEFAHQFRELLVKKGVL